MRFSVYFTGDQSLVSWPDKQLCNVLVYFTVDQSLVSWSDKQLCDVYVFFTGDKVNNYLIWSTACLFMTMVVIHNTSKLKTLPRRR